MKSVDETSRFMYQVSLGDNRRPSDDVLLAWHELLAPYTLADCLEALATHRRESTEYLQPAHIIGRVRDTHRYRALTVPAEANPEIETDYRSACRTLARAIREGILDRDAYEEYVEGTTPAAEFVRRVAARSVSTSQPRGELR